MSREGGTPASVFPCQLPPGSFVNRATGLSLKARGTSLSQPPFLQNGSLGIGDLPASECCALGNLCPWPLRATASDCVSITVMTHSAFSPLVGGVAKSGNPWLNNNVITYSIRAGASTNGSFL